MKKLKNVEVPSYFRCPISFEVMEDPVILSSGITYERSSIEQWMQAGNKACPVTRQALESCEFIPNHTLSQLIRSWCTNNGYTTTLSTTTTTTTGGGGITSLDLDLNVHHNIHECTVFLQELSRCPLDHHLWRTAVESEKLWSSLMSCLKAQQYACPVQVQEEAFAVMTNMFTLTDKNNNNNNIFERISTDELATIASFLHSSTKGLRIKAARMLLCMASSHDEGLRVKVGGLQNVVEGLLEVVRSREDDEAALKCMILICKTTRNRVQAIEYGAASLLTNILTRQKGKGKHLEQHALELLKIMSTCAEGRESLAKEHARTVPAILECLLCTRNISPVATEHGIVTLWYLICHSGCSEYVENSFVEAGGLSTMIMVLHCDCSCLTKQRAGELLKHFSWLWK